MQIVFLSIRPQVLNDTLKMVERNMKFISDVCIVCPSEIQDDFIIPERFSSSFISDDELIDTTVSKDHSLINFKLRSQLGLHPKVQSEFIMSDDDSRPIKETELSLFKKEDRYNSFFFYDLTQWKHHSTSFDKCLNNSGRYLKQNKLPTLAFASHMPQIINKEIFKEAMSVHENTSISYCEWSIYFNYAISKYPQQFHEPSPYVTMNWPDYPNIWKPLVEPGEFVFENFYPHLYNEGDLYGGIPPVPSENDQLDVLAEKKRRLEEYDHNHFFPWLTHKPFLKPLMKMFNGLPKSMRKQLADVAGLIND